MDTVIEFESLLDELRKLDSAVLALSGGLDSSFLLYALKQAGVRTLAVTGKSPTTPAQDLRDAESVASELGMPHRFIETREMDHVRFVENSPERCFHCKDVLFAALKKIAMDEGFSNVLDGTTADDLTDHRPGRRAAKAHGVLSPLAASGMTKQMIRAGAREAGLSISEKPASPCLSSRFSYGTRITPEGLERVAKAEELLARLGLNEFRVRDTDGAARIEVPKDQMELLFARRDEIVAAFKGLGFSFISLDLEGFQSGKLNRVLEYGQEGQEGQEE